MDRRLEVSTFMLAWARLCVPSDRVCAAVAAVVAAAVMVRRAVAVWRSVHRVG